MAGLGKFQDSPSIIPVRQTEKKYHRYCMDGYEILHLLVDGLSNYNPMIYNVS